MIYFRADAPNELAKLLMASFEMGASVYRGSDTKLTALLCVFFTWTIENNCQISFHEDIYSAFLFNWIKFHYCTKSQYIFFIPANKMILAILYR